MLRRRHNHRRGRICTVHPASVEAFFAESERFGTRMIAGKVLMDRNAPPALTDTPERAYAESKALIERWHGRGRQLYAITPRFAPTSSAAQLEAAGRLWREHPGTYVQTHLSEESRRDRLGRGAVPRARRLSRRLRRCPPGRAARHLRPWRPHGRGGVLPLPRGRRGALPLPDLQPLPRVRAVPRLRRQARRPPGPPRHRHRCRRRHLRCRNCSR